MEQFPKRFSVKIWSLIAKKKRDFFGYYAFPKKKETGSGCSTADRSKVCLHAKQEVAGSNPALFFSFR